jgi:hypothetical protein
VSKSIETLELSSIAAKLDDRRLETFEVVASDHGPTLTDPQGL